MKITYRNLLTIIIMTLIYQFSSAQTRYWSYEFANAIMERHANINDLTKKGWEYSNSIVLIGIEKMYYETGDVKYLDYIKKYIDGYVDASGNINFDASANNLDHLHPGWLCITLYEELGIEKYKLAAEKIRAEFNNQPTNASGGFWHKQKYPNQMWADGIYMAEPFLMRYGATFDELEYVSNEATKQTILVAENAYDSVKNLLYHGWDETKQASWADKTTGVSPEVWSRGMGWYCMALVDILDYLPVEHEKYNALLEILQNLALGIKNYQDSGTGLWYQVVDKGNLSDNWHEISGSAMFVYSLKKAVDKGYLDPETYTPVIEAGWTGVQSKFIFDTKDRPGISEFVLGMGIKNSYSEYISQSRVSTPSSKYPHGYCAVLLAASAMEFPLPTYSLSTSISGDGSIQVKDDILEGKIGTEVEVLGIPNDGFQFSGWTGDLESTENPLMLTLSQDIAIQANFVQSTAIRNPESQDVEINLSKGLNEIHVKTNSSNPAISLQIFNIKGVELINISNYPTNHFNVDIAQFKTGVYIAVVKSENGICRKKFVL